MDPISIIVTALATGAATSLAEEAVKDAYDGLKSFLQDRYGQVNVDLIETDPASEARRDVVKEDLAQTEAAQDEDLLRQAQTVLEAVEEQAPEAAAVVGVSLEEIRGASLHLKNIIARSGDSGPATGVSAKDVETTGDITIENVTAENAPGASRGATAPASAFARPIRILFLAANPTDTTQLRLGEEVREIDAALRQAEYREHFDLRQHHAVRVADLQGLLLRHQPDILHFSGHGSDAGEIILEDGSGRAHPVTPQALGSVFAARKSNIRCVVLNACLSQAQAEAIVQHVDAVVGMAVAIGDRAAISFATAFYQALAYGESMRTAFESGTAQIDLENLGEAQTPQLIAPHADPAQIDFVSDAGPHP